MDGLLTSGDYVVVEDGVLTHLGLADQYAGGPLIAIRQFLDETGGRYEIDRGRCDAFGRNATWNPEGYLRCVR